ncbi:hypothetical protein BN137_4212 [Cronobacter condimenti 1330]|uniref:Uncharacterized protein n=1 Tax=Cronobacter condimenti 1330 TaxID=1073999 RepID=K8A443_9ENTR|nr:hypothetical protein BN137_4212 [Cronobacter condimenti 1330]
MFKRAYLYPNPGGSGHAGGMNALNFILPKGKLPACKFIIKIKSYH